MTISHSKVLELLGKQISFDLIFFDERKDLFPSGVCINGLVESVVINFSGTYEILVNEYFYSLNEIKIR